MVAAEKTRAASAGIMNKEPLMECYYGKGERRRVIGYLYSDPNGFLRYCRRDWFSLEYCCD